MTTPAMRCAWRWKAARRTDAHGAFADQRAVALWSATQAGLRISVLGSVAVLKTNKAAGGHYRQPSELRAEAGNGLDNSFKKHVRIATHVDDKSAAQKPSARYLVDARSSLTTYSR